MRTLGVVEHSLSVKEGGSDYTWRMYDVGGAVCLASLFLNYLCANFVFLARPGRFSLNITGSTFHACASETCLGSIL